MDKFNQIDITHCTDSLEGLKQMPSDFVDCCVTSPPYYGLRDYGVDGQIGLEKSPMDYINRLTEVFMEVFRVLKPEGTLWLVIGDSYAGGNKGAARYPDNAKKWKQGTNKGTVGNRTAYKYVTDCKDKDLIGIPWMMAFALRERGWYLRQDIIWHKRNPMPESVTDRCTKAHEYIFLMSKSSTYYFDSEAISEPTTTKPIVVNCTANRYGGNKYTKDKDVFFRTKSVNAYDNKGKRNKRDVWSISTSREKGLHFATFPEQLITPCILAGCPKDGIVLDPFMGSGTTAMVARKYQRHFVGFELNPDYIDIINKKTQVTPYLFV